MFDANTKMGVGSLSKNRIKPEIAEIPKLTAANHFSRTNSSDSQITDKIESCKDPCTLVFFVNVTRYHHDISLL